MSVVMLSAAKHLFCSPKEMLRCAFGSAPEKQTGRRRGGAVAELAEASLSKPRAAAPHPSAG
ncbi:MAG: hypothetical protein EI684_00155 [Candidatus Viridilinea halotolerans]|uniref:Uncharacterized protein n=1 Tax=Candidatus Viridilinea halotolerans TaxID=2491704 RepID=A0A426UCF7_9CHLR|nr:MAG: hypothetical protein EI684_00155 [Candidatus Viridilinea halotolerans]